MAADAYERRVSAEEAREGYLLVLKDRLRFFPPVGEPFVLATPAGPLEARVEAEPCTCRGPELPHEHWRIRLAGLARGARVRVTREGEGYRLEAGM